MLSGLGNNSIEFPYLPWSFSLRCIVDCTRCGEEHLPILASLFSPDFPILLTLWLALEASSLLHPWCYAILVLSCIILVAVRSQIYKPRCSAYLLSETRKQSTAYFLRPSYLISC